ncbi:MAG: NifU family protein [Chloroflexi bacterium]|nr:NifU family protein [Chloroflexota bacterium]
MKERVEKALEGIRPYLQADGGDVELIDVSDDGVVLVNLVGACGGCPMSQMTLRNGVEVAIKEQVPEVVRVDTVGFDGMGSDYDSLR